MEFARPIRVVMLETHAPDVQAMEENLELAGLPAEVRSVATPDDVLFAAEDGALDIAVLNLGLPNADTLIEELRMLEGDKRLPIIAFSEDPLEAEHADHVFNKPQHEAEYMGIVAAIRFYWMAKAPSIMPPPTEEEEATDKPRRLSNIDLMGMPIEPIEAYLLSMIDGTMDLDEISLSIGKDAKETRAMLRRLAGLGAVAWRAPHPSMPPPAPPSSPSIRRPAAPPTADAKPRFERIKKIETLRRPQPAPASDGGKKPDARTPRAEPSRARSKGPEPSFEKATPEPAFEKAEPAAKATSEPASEKKSGRTISDERKKIIDDAFALLGEADHYELLGVERTAEKKVIRDAYFKLAKLFHTDTLYGAQLDEYGPKMDKVFHALTEAYEVLSKKKKRRAYDAYLGAVHETETLDAPPEPRPSTTPGERASMRPPAAPPATPSPAPEPTPMSTPKSTPKRPAASRRDMARKLLEQRSGRKARASGRSAMTPPAPGDSAPKAAVESLARTLKAVSQTTPRDDRVSRLVSDAKEAEAKGNFTGAAEAMRIASAWRPDDVELAEEAARLRHEALVQKAPAFEKRARYAEKNDNWQEAALAWTRVAEVRPDDADAALGAARAIVRAQGDLKQAAVYGKRAVELLPRSVQAHVTLAEVYIAAGMPSSAKRTLEKALSLDSKNEQARAMLQGLDA